MKRIKFIFDLDGTITAAETLPMIAERFGVREQIAELTVQTVRGNIPFVESFIRRVSMLGQLPVSQVADLLATAPLHEELVRFIRDHKEHCAVATGNLECWSWKLLERIGCDSFCSLSEVEDDRVVRLTQILRKEEIVERYRSEGWETVFIGCENDDFEAMRVADLAIAVGMTHQPSPSILPAADYLIYNEKTLCRQLNQLL